MSAGRRQPNAIESRTRALRRRELLRGALAVGAGSPIAALLGGCPTPPPRPPEGQWTNAVGTKTIHPSKLATPSSAAEIVSLVQSAEAGGKRIRMTGSGHSFSDVALTDDYLLLPTGLTRLLTLNRTVLKSAHASDRYLVRTQGGITLRALNAALDDKGLALENLGGYDAQTITGVAMTATHGSGLAYGPVTSQIVSIQIVTAGGAMLQIEPTDGITDPAKWQGHLDEDAKVAIKLVQNDDTFNSVGVSMGCLGIVYAVTLRTVDKFWLRERRSLVSWTALAGPDGFLDRLLHGRKLGKGTEPEPDHYEIYVNPYASPKLGPSAHTAILTERWRLFAPPPKTPENTKRGLVGSGHLLADPAARNLAEEALIALFDGAQGDLLHTAVDTLLAVLVDDDYTAESFKVFNLGDANKFRVWGIEMAFSLDQTIEATERMFEIAADLEKQNIHHSVPVSLRFVAPSQQHLAMQYGRATCMMEINGLVAARGSQTLLETYESTFFRELGARPHWGLDLDLLRGEDSVAGLYPAWPKWKTARAELNRSGVFDGRLTDRLGLAKPR